MYFTIYDLFPLSSPISWNKSSLLGISFSKNNPSLHCKSESSILRNLGFDIEFSFPLYKIERRLPNIFLLEFLYFSKSFAEQLSDQLSILQRLIAAPRTKNFTNVLGPSRDAQPDQCRIKADSSSSYVRFARGFCRCWSDEQLIRRVG